MDTDSGASGNNPGSNNPGLFPTTIVNSRRVVKEPVAKRLSTTETGTPASDNMFTCSDDAHTCTGEAALDFGNFRCQIFLSLVEKSLTLENRIVNFWENV